MESLPTRQSTITLEDVNADNWERISKLVVNRDQLALVPSNIHSLCEHQFSPGSCIWAICADKSPIGYIRVTADQQQEGYLQCFMVDQGCQGLMFGTRAMSLLRQKLKAQGMTFLFVKTMSFVAVRNDDSPEHFFLAVGFQPSADQEHELVCVL